MRRILLALIVILVVVLLMGCGKRQATGPSAGQIELEVAVFQGGFGLDFFKYAAREYEKEHPNVTIKIWGNPRIWEQLRPRFVAGDPPDLTWPGWGMDYWALVMEGEVTEMDKYLDEKAYDRDVKWKDTFVPSLLDKGKYNGHYYIMPYNNNVFGWWYNAGMFEKNGWSPPKTFDELLLLCEKIKRKGIAPITYQGKYPQYMLRGFLIPWAMSAGGMQAWKDAQNLKPGAWNGPAFLKAAQMVEQLAKRGYFQTGVNALTHTESQMEFLLGNAAMIPCGTWLGSEMKNQMPQGFRMRYFNPPVLPDGKGDPTVTSTGVETWIVPKKAKHPDEAADFYRFMTSLAMAKEFVREKNTLMSIVGSDEVELPPDLVEPARCMREAADTWDTDYADWYKSLGTETENAMNALLSGKNTPRQCVDRMEAAATKVRNDKSIPKHNLE